MIDMLSNAYNDNFDVAVLVAGDGDYIPLISEIKRLGKVIYLVFFLEKAYGMNPDLLLSSDQNFEVGKSFLEAWKTA